MEKILCRNELFKIASVETYNADNHMQSTEYKLIELPNRIVAIFETFYSAQIAMQRETRTWREIVRKTPFYFEVTFIA